MAEVLQCTGQLLQPAQGLLEALGYAAIAPAMGMGGLMGGMSAEALAIGGALRAAGARAAAAAVDGVEMVATAELKATHSVSRKAVARLARQVEADGGIKEPLKYVEDGGEKLVVDGNHRLRVARQLGIEQVPAQRVNLPYAGYKMPADLIFRP